MEDLSLVPNEDEGKYPPGFFYWIQYNAHIWNSFEQSALRIAHNKRKRYSARTIIEHMRWESDIRDMKGKPLFKLSNDMTPGLARLFMQKHGKTYPKFFQLNSTRG
jgi:hypothetical protein